MATKRDTWGQCMTKNTNYLVWGRKKYGKKFVLPTDIDAYRRKKLGLKTRPAVYRIRDK